jgi:hypothetical protein
MGKAIYGVLGGPDPRTAAELATLRARVRQLEAELSELRSAEHVGFADHDLDLALLTSQDTALV